MSETMNIGGQDWDVIHRYTRAQALADGVLVDVSVLAREAGFRVPVAVTAAVEAYLEPNEHERQRGQDMTGRTWDMLTVLRVAIRQATLGRELEHGEPELVFAPWFHMVGRDGFKNGLRRLRLKCHSGPGDEGEHVLTLMLPSED